MSVKFPRRKMAQTHPKFRKISVMLALAVLLSSFMTGPALFAAPGPTVSTSAATNAECCSATLNGTYSGASSSSYNRRGFFYSSTNTTPTYGGSGVQDEYQSISSSSGSITETLDNLTPGTTYYYQAYVRSSSGNNYYYGGVKTFTTSPFVTFNPDGSTTPAKSVSTVVTVNCGTDPEYAWSTSGTTQPQNKDFTDLPANKTVSLSSGTGSYYLWVRVKKTGSSDRAYVVSKSFLLDNTKPTITAPANVEKEATGPLTSVSSADLGTPTVSDTTSSADKLTVTNDAPAAGYPVGETTVTWTVEDEAGNKATATQKVTIKDTTKPTITAPSDKTVPGTGLLTPVTLGTPIVSDLVSSGNDLSVTNDAPAGGFPAGETTVTWTVTDKAGNSATAAQKVTITGYTVTFDTNEGSAVEPQDLYFGDTVTKPEDPERSGYIFKGWYSDEDLTTPWDFETDTVAAADKVLYARWLLVTIEPNDAGSGITTTGIAANVELPELDSPDAAEILVSLKVDEIPADNQPNFLVSAAGTLDASKKDILKAYDLSLMKTIKTLGGGSSTTPVPNSDIKGALTIRLPIPAEYRSRENLQVAYIDDNGTVTLLTSTVINEGGVPAWLEFTTDHFSAYAILASQLNPPVTGETENYIGIALLVLAAALLLGRRRVANLFAR